MKRLAPLALVMFAAACGDAPTEPPQPMAVARAFSFESFYQALNERGYVIYPGKLTVANTFRIGCIGRLGVDVIEGVLSAISEVLEQMGVTNRAGKPR